MLSDVRRWEEFWGAPAGVGRRRWNNLRTGRMLGAVLLLVGLATTCMGAVTVLQGDADAQIMSPSAVPRNGDIVRMSGRLHTTSPRTMPDDGAEVIRGRLRVSLVKSRTGGPTEVLEDWADDAATASLTDGANAIELEVAALPLQEDRRARGRLTRTSTRGGRPVRAEYGGETWDFDPEHYDHGTWRLDVERAYVTADQPVVLTGRFVDGRLLPTSGTSYAVSWGTPEEVAASRSRASWIMICLGPMMAVCGLLLLLLFSLKMAKARVESATKVAGAFGG